MSLRSLLSCFTMILYCVTSKFTLANYISLSKASCELEYDLAYVFSEGLKICKSSTCDLNVTILRKIELFLICFYLNLEALCYILLHRVIITILRSFDEVR